MTDPLRPLLGLIGAIGRARKVSSPHTSLAEHTPNSRSSLHRDQHSEALPFLERLSACLASTGIHDLAARRKLFVQTALLSEFGDELSLDPAFGELVEEICSMIAPDQEAISSLDALLARIVSVQNIPLE